MRLSEEQIERLFQNHLSDKVGSGTQKDLLSQASEGFEEWRKSTDYFNHVFTSAVNEAWQAAKLSQAKENEELKKENIKTLELIEPIHRENEELKKENEELKAKETHYDGTYYKLKMSKYGKKIVTVKGKKQLMELLESYKNKKRL